MTDYLHSPEISEKGFTCKNCGIELPEDVAVLGEDVVELGGAGTHWLPLFAHVGRTLACEKRVKDGVAIMACECDLDGCDRCNGYGVLTTDGEPLEVEQAAVAGVTKPAQPLTEFEKEVRRGAFNNFRMMREATRPE